MKKQRTAPTTTVVPDLRAMTERAQREPGLSQLLSLLEQVRAAERAIQDMAPGVEFVSGGTFSHTF